MIAAAAFPASYLPWRRSSPAIRLRVVVSAVPPIASCRDGSSLWPPLFLPNPVGALAALFVILFFVAGR